MLLQEFDIEIKDKKGDDNVAADHLSRIEKQDGNDEEPEINDYFPEEILMKIYSDKEPWFADFANYLVGKILPKNMTYQQKRKLFSDLKNFFWEEPHLFKICHDRIIRRCVAGPETRCMSSWTNCRTLWTVHHGQKSPRIWFLFANNIPRSSNFSSHLRSMSKNQKYIKTRRDAFKLHPGIGNIRYMGNRFHGSFPQI